MAERKKEKGIRYTGNTKKYTTIEDIGVVLGPVLCVLVIVLGIMTVFIAGLECLTAETECSGGACFTTDNMAVWYCIAALTTVILVPFITCIAAEESGMKIQIRTGKEEYWIKAKRR